MGGDIVKRRFVACSPLVLVLSEECDICATRNGETRNRWTRATQQALGLLHAAKGLVTIPMHTKALNTLKGSNTRLTYILKS